MSVVIETHDFNVDGVGYVIEERYDVFADNPRDFFDHLGTMVSSYHIDKKDCSRSRQIAHSRFFSAEEMEKAIEEMEGEPILAWTLYRMSHGSVSYALAEHGCNPYRCPWDSGPVGMVYVTKSRIREDQKVKRITKKIREKVFNILAAEVREFSAWANGDVRGYIAKHVIKRDEDGDPVEVEKVDSCWGFYGDDDGYGYMLEQAREACRHHASKLKNAEGVVA